MNRFLAGLTRSRLVMTGAMVLMHCISLSSVAAQVPNPQAPAAPPTIAVLALENSSGEAAQDFFASGMTDEIASALTSVRGLAVVARSSSFRLPPSMRDLKAIGQALNASYLVQGSARMAAERLRMNIRLVPASDALALWPQ